MEQKQPIKKQLARELLKRELRDRRDHEEEGLAIQQTFGKVSSCLAQRIGIAGVRALIARALVLAMADFLWLASVHVRDDGSLGGIDEAARSRSSEEMVEGFAVVLSHLLGLLEVLIGRDLSLRLLGEIWPRVLEVTADCVWEETQ
jgi:hypothetical protein